MGGLGCVSPCCADSACVALCASLLFFVLAFVLVMSRGGLGKVIKVVTNYFLKRLA